MIDDLFPGPDNTLTVLSFGAGQDSSALLEMYLQDHESFRRRYAPNDFIVVMSDTGDEHAETYRHVEYCQARCKQEGLPFFFITNDMGFHPRTWPDLRTFYRSKGTIGSKSYPKTCTSNLKLTPIYGFIEAYLEKTYGVTAHHKRGFYEFAARFGKVRVLVGIAAGEERRRADPSTNPNVWMRETIDVVYPLIDYGLDRQGCQDLIRSYGAPVPPPSNCILCPWMSLQELEYLRRFSPSDLDDWISLEATKLERFSHMNAVVVVNKKTGKQKIENRNFGVWGKKPLPVMAEEARIKFADWSDDQLRDYKFSHGHCMSSY